MLVILFFWAIGALFLTIFSMRWVRAFDRWLQRMALGE
jgi:hypothetical protein